MEPLRRSPRDIAQSLSQRERTMRDSGRSVGSWKRETYVLPRIDARAKAREWFDRFPKAAYMTEIEFWREKPDGCIEFTIRRLPTAD
jgi:hypothetical protein